jgi:hypothetical protein
MDVAQKAIEVYSIFDTIHDAAHALQTTSDCRKLQTYGLQVLADQVSDRVIDKLLNVGGATCEVRRTPGGVLVASNLAPTFQIAPPLERPGDVRVRQFLATYDAGVRGRELRKALELAFLAAPERWKLHVQTFSNGNVEMSRTETYTLDGRREFRFRRVKKGFRVWYGENGFGWSRE